MRHTISNSSNQHIVLQIVPQSFSLLIFNCSARLNQRYYYYCVPVVMLPTILIRYYPTLLLHLLYFFLTASLRWVSLSRRLPCGCSKSSSMMPLRGFITIKQASEILHLSSSFVPVGNHLNVRVLESWICNV